MRILTVGAIKGGSVPVGRAIHTAFKQIGEDADFLDYSDFLSEFNNILATPNPELSSAFLLKCRRRLLKKVSEFKPDVIMGIAQSPINNITLLTNLRKKGIILCYWFVEDCRVFEYWRKYAPSFDHFFILQKEPYLSELKHLGCRNADYLPAAFDTNLICFNGNTESRINISFMGAPYPNRIYHFSQLKRRDFQIYGEGWTEKDHSSVVLSQHRVSEIEARMVYARTKININLHSSVNPVSFGEGDFVNPRTFELAGMGAFQLTDYRNLLPLHFDPDSELAVYRKWNDLALAIDYFLQHDEERDHLAKKARERVLKEHSYEHRAREIVSIINQ